MLGDKVIEPRRTIDDAWSEDWAVQMLVLKGTVNVDWRTFARTAKALLDSRALEAIPIMEYIWQRTKRDLVNEELVLGECEWTDGMMGKRELGKPAFSDHRAAAAGWAKLSTEGANRRLDMETDRLLFGERSALLWWPTAGKPQRGRRVEGWAATGQDAQWHVRQENPVCIETVIT